MFIEILSSKIHRATVTDADVNYVGSITIDETLIKKANLKLHQKVNIYDITNGERFSTYVIKGEAGSGAICLNGAAAKKVSKGDKIIIAAYASMTARPEYWNRILIWGYPGYPPVKRIVV